MAMRAHPRSRSRVCPATVPPTLADSNGAEPVWSMCGPVIRSPTPRSRPVLGLSGAATVTKLANAGLLARATPAPAPLKRHYPAETRLSRSSLFITRLAEQLRAKHHAPKTSLFTSPLGEGALSGLVTAAVLLSGQSMRARRHAEPLGEGVPLRRAHLDAWRCRRLTPWDEASQETAPRSGPLTASKASSLSTGGLSSAGASCAVVSQA